MLQVLLAALQILWMGPGHPLPDRAVPAVIARWPSGRVPQPPIELRTFDGRTQVVADYRVTPGNGLTFSDEAPLYGRPYAEGTYIYPAEYRGPVTITARYMRETAALPGFVYNAIAVSCYISMTDGLQFDAGGIAQPSGTPGQSDIYQSGPANTPQMDIFRGCTGAFIDPAQTTFPLHVPYGGTVIRRESGAYIGDVSASAWRDDFTVVPQLRAGDVLLFKTHDGNVAKFLAAPVTGDALTAAYIVAPRGGEFSDYLTWHPKRKHHR